MEHTEAYKGDVKQLHDPYRLHLVKNTKFRPQPPHPEKVGVVHTAVLEAPENAEDYKKQVCGSIESWIVCSCFYLFICTTYKAGTNHTFAHGVREHTYNIDTMCYSIDC